MPTTADIATLSDDLEDLESFRLRARAWLAENMPKLGPDADPLHGYATDRDDEIVRGRMLQRKLHDGGFAGICYPKEYGGQGLSPEHQNVFTEETAGYEMPLVYNVPSLTILSPTLLDFGTEEQKKRHLPAILRGDEMWVQFLSEPTGGSDLAGCLTRATQDGDVWILNGSKIWSSGAYYCDYAMCLARTNWDAPKHRGLTMFIVKIHQPGVQVDQIKQVNGSMEFCQEFFDDVAIPAENIVGQVNDGWTVASRLLFHERNAVGGASPYASGVRAGESRHMRVDYVTLAKSLGKEKDAHVRQLVADSHVIGKVQNALVERVTTGINNGHFPGPAGSLLRLATAVTSVKWTNIANEIAGTSAVAWKKGDPGGAYGTQFIFRQGACLGGGSNEMQRNIISERVLGMPRDRGEDPDAPFSQVRKNTLPTRKR
jgi:alkylation response protein AidB-like acyl-CoA dehydrogenase